MQPLMDCLIGYFVSEVGTLNQVTILIRFESFEHRQQLLAQMAQDPAWCAHLKRVRAIIHHQENRVLTPAPLPDLVKLWSSSDVCIAGHGGTSPSRSEAVGPHTPSRSEAVGQPRPQAAKR